MRAAASTLQSTRVLADQRRLFARVNAAPLRNAALRRTIYDAEGTAALPGVCARGEYGESPLDSAVVDAFAGMGATHRFFETVFLRNSLDNHGMRLDATVHYREHTAANFLNAFWNGRQLVFGDGDGDLFGCFTGSLDVIAHELAHGVIQFEANFEMTGQSGALHESFADIFGSLVKQWTLHQTVDQADWLVGRELFVDRGTTDRPRAIRSLKAPGFAFRDDPDLGDDPQPDRMSSYGSQGPDTDPHLNCGIPNRAFYLACVNLGDARAWERPAKIWYDALATLGRTAQFVDAATTTVAIADRLYGSDAARAVRNAWEQVEVLETATAVPATQAG